MFNIKTITYSIDSKGKINKITTTDRTLTYGSNSGKYDVIKNETTNQNKEDVNPTTKNSAVTKDLLVSAFTEFAGKRMMRF